MEITEVQIVYNPLIFILVDWDDVWVFQNLGEYRIIASIKFWKLILNTQDYPTSVVSFVEHNIDDSNQLL